MQELATGGARVDVPRRGWDYAIGVGLRRLTLRRMLLETDGLYRLAKKERPLIETYANAIAPMVETLQ